MGDFDFDTVLAEMPARKAKPLSADVEEQLKKQEHVWSLHPQCPEGVEYVGSRRGEGGYMYDYYVDGQGIYWHSSRKADVPVVIKFCYGGKRYSAKKRKILPI